MLRRFTFTALAILAVLSVGVLCLYEGPPTFEEKMREALGCCSFTTYTDSDYGYTVSYPEFFRQVPDSLCEPGACCFRYWDHDVRLEQSVFLESNPQSLSPRQAMDVYAVRLHAECKRFLPDAFILSGPVYVNGVPLSGTRFHAKFVKSQRVWFVQRLVYPEGYDKAVTRLVRHIDRWQVWSSHPSRRLPLRTSADTANSHGGGFVR
jgi:hypothetical protein